MISRTLTVKKIFGLTRQTEPMWTYCLDSHFLASKAEVLRG